MIHTKPPRKRWISLPAAKSILMRVERRLSGGSWHRVSVLPKKIACCRRGPEVSECESITVGTYDVFGRTSSPISSAHYPPTSAALPLPLRQIHPNKAGDWNARRSVWL